MVTELSKTELTEIYRQLDPDAHHLGDPPELWNRAVLLQQIRVTLRQLRSTQIVRNR
jgi:hypothetical protein